MKNNNVLLMTGGTGSFGKAILNRFPNTDEFSEIDEHNTHVTSCKSLIRQKIIK